MIGGIIAISVIVLVIWQVLYFAKKRKLRQSSVPENFPPAWTDFLVKRVAFFRGLNEVQKRDFEQAVLGFFREVIISPVKTKITQEDRLLVGAAAIIPIFFLGERSYPNLREVLIYPSAFDERHQFANKQGRIAGMVGNGYMNGTMILSKTSILGGFMNNKDGNNTAIHEFVHLIDGWDGEIDGIPGAIIDKPLILPWIDAMKQGIDDIRKNESNIDDYGGTNSAEFLAVCSEYLFENPARLKREHPEVHRLLHKMFHPELNK